MENTCDFCQGQLPEEIHKANEYLMDHYENAGSLAFCSDKCLGDYIQEQWDWENAHDMLL